MRDRSWVMGRGSGTAGPCLLSYDSCPHPAGTGPRISHFGLSISSCIARVAESGRRDGFKIRFPRGSVGSQVVRSTGFHARFCVTVCDAYGVTNPVSRHCGKFPSTLHQSFLRQLFPRR